MQSAICADVYDLLNKFRRKYDCDYHTEKGKYLLLSYLL